MEVVLLNNAGRHLKCLDGRNVNRMEVVEVDIAVVGEEVKEEVAASKEVGIKEATHGTKIRSHSGVVEVDINISKKF